MHLRGIYLGLQNTNMQDAHFLGGISAKAFFLAGKFYSKLIVKMIYSFRKIYYFAKHNKAYILLTVSYRNNYSFNSPTSPLGRKNLFLVWLINFYIFVSPDLGF